MTDSALILRKWTGLIRTEDEAAYEGYITRTGMADYGQAPGNRGFQMLFRALGDGRSEVTTLSWWSSLETIKGFAGEDVTLARYYPEDDQYLLERPLHVEHHRVVQRSTKIG
ncbi:hypothetical protein [Caulobacter segnis]